MIDFLIHILADVLVIPIVLIGAYAMLRRVPPGNRYHVYVRVMMMGLTALLFAKLMSLLYQPGTLRPFMEIGLEPKALYLNNPGFPSDHAVFVFAIAFAVWGATRNARLFTTLMILAILVAVGRVLGLVHTPLDVIGGFLAAFFAAATWYPRAFFSKH
jgi:undecaprenyl-diphosphatase